MRPSRIAMLVAAVGAAVCAGAALTTNAQPQVTPEMAARMAAAQEGANKKSDFPAFDKVIEGYEKVVSTADGKSLYTLYKRDKDGQVLAELPRNFESQKCYIATAIAAGIPAAGIQFGDHYVYWKRFDNRLALIQPNLATRTTGDIESRKSRDAQFTDMVIVDVPIVTMGPGGGPVIDMTSMLAKNASTFFGARVRGANTRLISIANAKAFPQNIELAFEMPAANGQFLTAYYSWSVLPENTGYTPREADPRVGYFATTYTDLGKIHDESVTTRYINRWKLEKADPSLKLSPPKEPIVFYIEHTTPIRYRQAVREGALEWNKAFEKVGILNAIEVYQQDARTGAHMDKDPEDVRYNFLRWHTNNIGFAIGPSRVDPRTGQILDADVLMNDGWLRYAIGQWENVLPQLAIETFGPETLTWLEQNPQWDPRIRLADAQTRETLLAERRHRLATSGPSEFGGHALANAETELLNDHPYAGLVGRVSQLSSACYNTAHRGMDLALVQLHLTQFEGDQSEGHPGPVPEHFINAIVKDVMMHEVGHVLGLRHNFKASSAYTMEQINSEEFKGKPITGSVMDYNAMNYNFDVGDTQGEYVMTTLGAYDVWAIEYGYSLEKDLKPILSRVSEPELAYATDEDLNGPDPYARQRDMGQDTLNFVEQEMRMVQDLRTRILDRSVKEGDSWSKTRTAYQVLLGQHVRNVITAANWIGGSYVNRDLVGDPGDRDPVIPVETELQRQALNIVINHTFFDDAYGLTPDLLAKMTTDKWLDMGWQRVMFMDQTWNVHDNILGVQAAAMTAILNPTTLRRVFDNEFRVPSDQDALTLAEVLQTVTDSAWKELDAQQSSRRFTAREPMVSSLRRNLQSEHVDRLIDLMLPGGLPGAASKPISDLASMHLRNLSQRIGETLEKANSAIDPYTVAHLSKTKQRIDSAMEAQFIYNRNDVR